MSYDKVRVINTVEVYFRHEGDSDLSVANMLDFHILRELSDTLIDGFSNASAVSSYPNVRSTVYLGQC